MGHFVQPPKVIFSPFGRAYKVVPFHDQRNLDQVPTREIRVPSEWHYHKYVVCRNTMRPPFPSRCTACVPMVKNVAAKLVFGASSTFRIRCGRRAMSRSEGGSDRNAALEFLGEACSTSLLWRAKSVTNRRSHNHSVAKFAESMADNRGSAITRTLLTIFDSRSSGLSLKRLGTDKEADLSGFVTGRADCSG